MVFIYFSDTCVLPQYPEFGRWIIFDSNVSDSNNFPGKSVNLDTIIEMQCPENFALEGEIFLICEKNGWSSKIGKCISKWYPKHFKMVYLDILQLANNRYKKNFLMVNTSNFFNYSFTLMNFNFKKSNVHLRKLANF